MLCFMGCASAPRYLYTTPETKATLEDKNTLLLLKNTNKTAILTASYYGEDFHGKLTSNGEVFDMYGMTAAHKSLPFGTVLQVTYPPTGQSVTVVVNDRGPFVPGRDLDLSYGAARKIGLVNDGTGKVKVKVLKWGNDPEKK
ncbi:MAG TPA: septal ring lytic transglycosylase RlpA family protein [Candidatus Marinimicrobia bacterium]|nr:septal ring lytic transglycosylase RlpA family protein [Candidatus Neomarinimicrobiota bacterium]HRS51592.1 septal ring lytic transglycosylase RlpA family protein [Candidatus Neomarinimicrobiota bacterium]HRU92330.1 septal ring lytic transglycosylase RlpA family protein [Candidatus Neomarinimicrobiota bacterium]